MLIITVSSIDDFSRVKLREIPGEEGSDYINASFLDVSYKQFMRCTITSKITHQNYSSGVWETKGLHCSTRYILGGIIVQVHFTAYHTFT